MLTSTDPSDRAVMWITASPSCAPAVTMDIVRLLPSTPWLSPDPACPPRSPRGWGGICGTLMSRSTIDWAHARGCPASDIVPCPGEGASQRSKNLWCTSPTFTLHRQPPTHNTDSRIAKSLHNHCKILQSLAGSFCINPQPTCTPGNLATDPRQLLSHCFHCFQLSLSICHGEPATRPPNGHCGNRDKL